MARNRKCFIENFVYYVTSRTERGLPLACNVYVVEIIKSILAQSQKLYPVDIGVIVVMGNHIHMLLSTRAPVVLDQFMRYFKTESGRAINKMMGRRKGKVWEDGYDSPPMLSMDSFVEKATYILTNPQKANLVEKITDYPGIHSFGSLSAKDGREVFDCFECQRSNYMRVKEGDFSIKRWRKYYNLLKGRARKGSELRFDLRVVFEAMVKIDKHYGYSKQYADITYEEFVKMMFENIVKEEEVLKNKRKRRGRGVVGAKSLERENIYKKHEPKKYGKRMICIASDVELRKRFLRFYRKKCQECEEAYESRKLGGVKDYPAGFYALGVGFIPCHEFPEI